MLYSKELSRAILFLSLSVSLFGQDETITPKTASNPPAGTEKLGARLPLTVVDKSDPKSLNSLLSTISYSATPGDVYQFTIVYDKLASYSYPVTVQEDNKIDIPIIGSVDTKGVSYAELREKVIGLVMQKKRLDFVDLTPLALATFETHVIGAVNTPGPVLVSSLTRLGEALTLAGGLTFRGSYRQIEIRNPRNGTRIIDLSRYSQSGSDEDDPILHRGDMIYVPLAQRQVSISGEVAFPGYYEVLPGETVQGLLAFAGGLKRGSTPSFIEIRRLDPEGNSALIQSELSSVLSSDLLDGDTVMILLTNPNPKTVIVEGALYGRINDVRSSIQVPQATQSAVLAATGDAGALTVPGPIKVSLPYFSGMTMHYVLQTLGGPTPYAIPEKCAIYRTSQNQTISFDVNDLWQNPEKAKALEVMPDDHILIPMDDQFVTIGGEVVTPRSIPHSYRENLSHYIKACGGITDMGDPNGIWLGDAAGKKIRKVSLDYEPKAEDMIIIDKNFATIATNFAKDAAPYFVIAVDLALITDYVLTAIINYNKLPH